MPLRAFCSSFLALFSCSFQLRFLSHLHIPFPLSSSFPTPLILSLSPPPPFLPSCRSLAGSRRPQQGLLRRAALRSGRGANQGTALRLGKGDALPRSIFSRSFSLSRSLSLSYFLFLCAEERRKRKIRFSPSLFFLFHFLLVFLPLLALPLFPFCAADGL